jgi:hypothetical protein
MENKHFVSTEATLLIYSVEYDKQYQQEKAAFIERTRQSTDRSITKMINNL